MDGVCTVCRLRANSQIISKAALRRTFSTSTAGVYSSMLHIRCKHKRTQSASKTALVAVTRKCSGRHTESKFVNTDRVSLINQCLRHARGSAKMCGATLCDQATSFKSEYPWQNPARIAAATSKCKLLSHLSHDVLPDVAQL